MGKLAVLRSVFVLFVACASLSSMAQSGCGAIEITTRTLPAGGFGLTARLVSRPSGIDTPWPLYLSYTRDPLSGASSTASVQSGIACSGLCSTPELTMNPGCDVPGTGYTVSASLGCRSGYATLSSTASGPTVVVPSSLDAPKPALKRLTATAVEATTTYSLPPGVATGTLSFHQIDASGTATSLGSTTVSGPSGELVSTLTVAGGERTVTVRATLSACGQTATQETSVAPMTCCAPGTPPSLSGDPVSFVDGNMRYTETDPLPPLASTMLTRTYDSDEQVSKLFGRGWTSFLDSRLTTESSTPRRAYVRGVTGDVTIFVEEASGFVQQWPRGTTGLASLTFDSGTSTYAYRTPGSATMHRYRSSDGKYIGFVNLENGHGLAITYDSSGLPQSVVDSWTSTQWTFTTDSAARRVTAVTVNGNVWNYQYDGNGNLTSVALQTTPWRTYEYSSNRLTAVKDDAGRIVESHTYDSNGRATDSTGPTDEISSIQYGLAGPSSVPNSTLTRVTHRAGAVVDYVLAPVASQWRTVMVIGGCATCGGGSDSLAAYDDQGRAFRVQNASGYIIGRQYLADGRVSSERNALKPASCDPATATDKCRFATAAALGSALLEATAESLLTTYTYGNAAWPDRPTTISSESVLATSNVRTETLEYDNGSGRVLSRVTTGWTGSPAAQQTRTSTTSYYNGTEAAAFDPGPPFDSAWLTLPQPPYAVKVSDGPATDVTDQTTSVHYPVHASVPAAWRGRLAAIRNAAGHVTKFGSYTVFGTPLEVTDPNGVVRISTEDALGRLLTTTLKAVVGCNTGDDPLCATDIVEVNNVYENGVGKLQEQIGTAEKTQFTYDSRGRISTQSRGGVTGGMLERLETTYNTAGLKDLIKYLAFESSAWAVKRADTFTYDSEGRLATTGHYGTTATTAYQYDEQDRVASVRDQNHTTPNTFYTYGPAGALKKVTQTLSTAPSGTIGTSYGYDRNGNVTSVTDPNGNVTSYVYDDFGQMILQTSPVTGQTIYVYDARGLLTSTTDARNTTQTKTYDALGRPLTATGDGYPITWTYDATQPERFGIGRLAVMDDNVGDATYSYDRRGLLRRETRVFDAGPVDATSYAHDARGNRTTVSYPSGTVVTYAYDYAGRPLSAAAGATTFVSSAKYRPFGPAFELNFGNGTQQQIERDGEYRNGRNRLLAGTTLLADYDYEHDGVGNVTDIADLTDASYSRKFGYDDLNRLTQADTGVKHTVDDEGVNIDVWQTLLWGPGTYTYDAMGNIKSIRLGPGTAAGREAWFRYRENTPKIELVTATEMKDPDGLLRSGPRRPAPRPNSITPSRPVTYDDAGNELTYEAVRTYTARGLLASTTPDSGPEGGGFGPRITYSYDGRGIRLIRSDRPSAFVQFPMYRFTYSPELRLLASAEVMPGAPNSTSLLYDIIWFGDLPVGQINFGPAASVRYTFADHLGTPLIQTDNGANIVWRAEYEPFGQVAEYRVGSATDQPLRFPGQEYDHSREGTDEHYNVFRWYRSGWGRYTQADPIGLDGGLNVYRYAANNPTGNTDALGLSSRTRRPSEMDCCELSRRIDEAANELEERHRYERDIQARVTSGALKRMTLENMEAYIGHRMRYDQLQQRLRDLNSEFFDRCGPPPLKAVNWSARPFPGWGYIWSAWARTTGGTLHGAASFLARNPPKLIPAPPVAPWLAFP